MDKKDITIRALDSGEWEIFREMRLHALKTMPQVFFSKYEDEVKAEPANWQTRWLDRKGKCTFGVFDGQKLVGITGVFTDRHDTSGKTAVLGASYLLPDYRGMGLSKMMYKARLDWAAAQTHMTRAVVSHRKSNDASRKASQAFGFQFVKAEPHVWPDGTTEDDLCYELDLEILRATLKP